MRRKGLRIGAVQCWTMPRMVWVGGLGTMLGHLWKRSCCSSAYLPWRSLRRPSLPGTKDRTTYLRSWTMLALDSMARMVFLLSFLWKWNEEKTARLPVRNWLSGTKWGEPVLLWTTVCWVDRVVRVVGMLFQMWTRTENQNPWMSRTKWTRSYYLPRIQHWNYDLRGTILLQLVWMVPLVHVW